MREELAKRVGRRGEFHATFVRSGVWKNRFGVRKTALFINVRDEMQQLVTDHIWFVRGKQMDKLDLQNGDRVRFIATVAPYWKRATRDGFDDWDTPPTAREKDFKLIYPTNMSLVNRKAEQSPLPLFGEPQEAS